MWIDSDAVEEKNTKDFFAGRWVVEHKAKIQDEPQDFQLLRHPVSLLIPDHPFYRQEEILATEISHLTS